MQALVDEYEHPSGELVPAQLESLLNEALPFQATIQLMDHFDFLSNAVQEAKQGFEIRGFDFDGELPLVGEVSLSLVCPGFEPDQPPDAAANGRLELLIPIEHGGLGPSGAGHADHCRFNGAAAKLAAYVVLPGDLTERDIEVDGPLKVHVGETVALGKSIELKPLVEIDGRVDVEGLPTFEHVDFRIPSLGVSETSITFGGQQVIVFSEQLRLGVRERRGTWLCQEGDITRCLPDF